MLLGDILVGLGKVTPQQVAAALELQQRDPRRKLGEILVENQVLAESDLLEALAREFGCDVVEAIHEDMVDPLLVANLPVEWARSNGVLPISWKGKTAIATSDPSGVSVIDDIALLLGREVVTVLAPQAVIGQAIERCYFRKEDKAEDVLKDMERKDGAPVRAQKTSDDLLRVADQAPVTQLVNVILLEAVKAAASDVHVEPFADRLRVRYRVDGLLYDQSAPPKHLEAALVSRLKVMAKLDIAEKRLPQDGTARVRVGEREIDIRVSTVPVAEGERVVLRLLNRESTLRPLADLGMPEDVLLGFRTAIRQPHGVLLVTGPTGSGKTTTLYAALQEVDTLHSNVLTVEDPIEYQLPNVGQIQVKPKIGLDFAHGLRHILRQDPDIILVGETRDLETAEIAVRAALTGHLVFTTLHTNDATSAPTRLIDMGIAPYLLASALRACLAQRLIRTLCPKCREAARPSEEEMTSLGPGAKQLKGRTAYRAKGCPACLGGYKGRTGVYEFLSATAGIQEDIRAGTGSQALRRKAVSMGMRTMLDDALAKVAAGRTSLAEVLRSVGQPDAELAG